MIALIFAIINYQNLELVLNSGITPEMFPEKERMYFQWILDFYARYNKVPSAQAFKSQFNIVVESSPDPLQYYIDKFLERLDMDRLVFFLSNSVKKLPMTAKYQDIVKLKMDIVKYADSIKDSINVQNKPVTISGVLKELVSTDVMQQVILPLPWGYFRRLYIGIKKGELWLLVARAGIGKTYLALYMLSEWLRLEEKYPLLIITTELTVEEIVQRILVTWYNVLPDKAIEPIFLKSFLQNYKEAGELYIQQAYDIDDVWTLIVKYKPKLVFIDSMYFLTDKEFAGMQLREFERVASNLKKLRQMSMKSGVAFLLTSQLSRNVKANSLEVTLNDLAYTDVFGQISDFVVSIVVNQELAENHLRLLKVIKARRAGLAISKINFKFNPIDFTEYKELADEIEY